MVPSLALLLPALFAVDDKPAPHPAVFECSYARSFCFDAAGTRLAGVTQRGELLLWPSLDAPAAVVTPLERKPNGTIFDRAPSGLVLTPAGTHAILFYYDGRIQVWDLDARRKVKDLVTDRVQLTYGRRSPDGARVACLSHGREGDADAVLLWNTRDWSPAGRVESVDRILDYCFSPDGRQVLLAVGYPTDQKNKGFTGLVAFDVETKQEVGSIEYGSGFPTGIAMSSDGRWVATGGGDAVPTGHESGGRSLSGHLRIFDWKAKKLVAEPYTQPSDYVRVQAFSPDGKRLFSGAESHGASGRAQASMRCFSADEGWKELGRVELGSGNPHGLAVSPDSRSLVVTDDDGLKLVDARTFTVVRPLAKFKFYPDEKEEFDRLRANKTPRKKGA